MRKYKKGRKPEKRRRVMVTLPNDLWKRLRVKAVEEEIPASYLLQRALELFLEKSGPDTTDGSEKTQETREDAEGSLF